MTKPTKPQEPLEERIANAIERFLKSPAPEDVKAVARLWFDEPAEAKAFITALRDPQLKITLRQAAMYLDRSQHRVRELLRDGKLDGSLEPQGNRYVWLTTITACDAYRSTNHPRGRVASRGGRYRYRVYWLPEEAAELCAAHPEWEARRENNKMTKAERIRKAKEC